MVVAPSTVLPPACTRAAAQVRRPLLNGSVPSEGICLRQSLGRHERITAELAGLQHLLLVATLRSLLGLRKLLPAATHTPVLYEVVPKAAQLFGVQGRCRIGEAGFTTSALGALTLIAPECSPTFTKQRESALREVCCSNVFPGVAGLPQGGQEF